jgi:hypothetical protein
MKVEMEIDDEWMAKIVRQDLIVSYECLKADRNKYGANYWGDEEYFQAIIKIIKYYSTVVDWEIFCENEGIEDG